MKKRRIILHPADATEESGGLLPTDVGDFALGKNLVIGSAEMRSSTGSGTLVYP